MPFLNKQKDFIGDVTTFILAYIAGFGAGKTYAGGKKSLLLSALNHGLAGMAVSPTIPMLRDTTRRTFIEQLEEEEINFSFKATENKVILTDINSEIWFRSADDPNKLKGSNLAWVWLDEPSLMKKEALDIAISRARDPKARKRQVFLTGTPEGFNWLYYYFREPSRNKRVIRASTAENSFLPEEYISHLYENYDEKLAKQYIAGEWVNINQGQVYYAFSREKHVRPTKANSQDLWLTFDFNINPMTTSICRLRVGHKGEQKQVVEVIKVINTKNGNTDNQCRVIKDYLREIGHSGKLSITGDASNPRSTSSNMTDWDIIKLNFPDAEYKLRNSNPAIQDRVNAVNSKFMNSRGEIGIVIDEHATEMIQDLEQVSWQEGSRTIDKTNKLLTHNSDNLGYLIYNLFPIMEYKSTKGYYR